MPKRKAKDRRKYICLDSVFPVDYRLLASENKNFLSDWLQGFTKYVLFAYYDYNTLQLSKKNLNE